MDIVKYDLARIWSCYAVKVSAVAVTLSSAINGSCFPEATLTIPTAGLAVSTEEREQYPESDIGGAYSQDTLYINGVKVATVRLDFEKGNSCANEFRVTKSGSGWVSVGFGVWRHPCGATYAEEWS